MCLLRNNNNKFVLQNSSDLGLDVNMRERERERERERDGVQAH